MIALKHLAIFLAIFAAVVAGGFLLGEIAYEINIRQAALESAPHAQHSTPAHQPVSEVDRTGASGEVAPPVATEAPPVATVQTQPTSAPATGPAKKGTEAPHNRQRK